MLLAAAGVRLAVRGGAVAEGHVGGDGSIHEGCVRYGGRVHGRSGWPGCGEEEEEEVKLCGRGRSQMGMHEAVVQQQCSSAAVNGRCSGTAHQASRQPAAVPQPASPAAYQAGLWLRDGYWTPLPISALGLPHPVVEWRGLQKLIDWTFEAPLSAGFIALAFLLVLIGGRLEPSK